MCLIINLPKENPRAHITDKDLQIAIDRNYNGMGVMYPVERDGKRAMYVGYCTGTAEEQFEFYHKHRALAKRGFACHVRLTTAGDNSVTNYHPHRITDDIWAMHNGTIAGYGKGDESDTVEYVRTVLKPIISKNPSVVTTKAFREMIERDIGTNNKLLIMDKNGNVTYFNKDAGIRRNGAWLSNDYSVSGCEANKGWTTRVNEFGIDEEWCSKAGAWIEDDYCYPDYGAGYNNPYYNGYYQGAAKVPAVTAKQWGIKIPNMSKEQLVEAIEADPMTLATAIHTYTEYGNWASHDEIEDDCWTDASAVAHALYYTYNEVSK